MPPENKFVAVILTEFRGSYLGAWSEGMMSEKAIRAAVRATAFSILAEQDEATDLRRVIVKLESAVEVVMGMLAAGDAGTGPSARVRPLFKK